jgi:hypothetical protein
MAEHFGNTTVKLMTAPRHAMQQAACYQCSKPERVPFNINCCCQSTATATSQQLRSSQPRSVATASIYRQACW